MYLKKYLSILSTNKAFIAQTLIILKLDRVMFPMYEKMIISVLQYVNFMLRNKS